MKNASRNLEYLYEIPNNFENTESKLKPFYHTDLKNSLETIVFKEKHGKEKRFNEEFFLLQK